MPTRYQDRDYDRGEQDYGRRRDSEYGRSGERSQERYGYGREENARYAGESRWRGQYGGAASSRRGREYEGGGREGSGRGWETNRDYTSGSDRSYGSYGQHYYGQDDDAQPRFGESSSSYSRRYDYPTDYPSRDMSSNQGGRSFDYDRSRYGRGQEHGYDYERDRYGSGGERGWWDRASDAVASWFGDEEAERRRWMDQQREQYRGRGPKGYKRSDERIKEDVNDRLSEGYLDASDIEVTVANAEVTLTGTVNSRADKRRAEEIAEYVTGVTNVENRLRLKQSGSEGYSGTTTTETTTAPTSTASAAAGSGTMGTGRTRS